MGQGERYSKLLGDIKAGERYGSSALAYDQMADGKMARREVAHVEVDRSRHYLTVGYAYQEHSKPHVKVDLVRYRRMEGEEEGKEEYRKEEVISIASTQSAQRVVNLLAEVFGVVTGAQPKVSKAPRPDTEGIREFLRGCLRADKRSPRATDEASDYVHRGMEASQLYREYCEFCQDKHSPVSQKAFGAYLRSRGIGRYRGKGGRYFYRMISIQHWLRKCESDSPEGKSFLTEWRKIQKLAKEAGQDSYDWLVENREHPEVKWFWSVIQEKAAQKAKIADSDSSE